MLNCGYLGRKVCAGHLCGLAAWWGQLPGELDAGPLLVCEHSGGHLVTVDEEDKQVPNSSGVHAVFDPICSISVPELPQPLEEWNVVEQVQVQVTALGTRRPWPSYPSSCTAARPPVSACPSRSGLGDPYPSISRTACT